MRIPVLEMAFGSNRPSNFPFFLAEDPALRAGSRKSSGGQCSRAGGQARNLDYITMAFLGALLLSNRVEFFSLQSLQLE